MENIIKEAMEKETLDQAQQKYCPYHGKKVPCGACQDLMDKTHKETPAECPDCKCTNLVSDQCKGECLCHHPELTPTEEWESEVRFAGSNLLDDTLETRYGMLKHHPPEDIPKWFVDVIRSLLTSHDAELRRKVIKEIDHFILQEKEIQTDSTVRLLKDLKKAVLALLGKK